MILPHGSVMGKDATLKFRTPPPFSSNGFATTVCKASEMSKPRSNFTPTKELPLLRSENWVNKCGTVAGLGDSVIAPTIVVFPANTGLLIVVADGWKRVLGVFGSNPSFVRIS
jgi:hypothetical protein